MLWTMTTSFSYRPLAKAITAVLAAALLLPVTVAAQNGTVLTLGTVQARSAAERELSARSVFTSVDLIGGDVLQPQKVDHSWELLMNAPGVQVTQFKMGTDAGRF